MKILFISELYPLANKGGEFIRNYGLCKLLERSGHEIEAILGKSFHDFSLDQAHKENYILHDFLNHYDSKRLKDACLKFVKQPDLIHKIDLILSKFNPDVVYIDYYFYGQYINFFKKKNIPVIYGTHNVQSRINLQDPVKSFRNKIARFVTFLLLRFHELYFFRKADALIAVSEDDLKFYSKWFSRIRLYNIPNFLDEAEYAIKKEAKENYIIMTGNFNAFQNAQGLEWFLKYVWDEELSARTHFIVAGRASDKVFNEINKKQSYKGVDAIGEVDDMKPYLAKGKAAIVPLLHGSGTRLKCIESMALKTQLISTSLGAEGIEHQGSIIISNKPDEFKKAISDVLQGKTDHTEKAYSVFLSKYSLAANREMFNNIVRELTQ